ncbi:hypothetical protein SAMD00019534_042900 [Acytostelium subglobosum LB1]|uniref:hypothetical protein n=1 Tax=Acytostelium subglobosum LB1 TaxID=1410327 RepID=UPI000644BDB5|nr:hypothetical protein SAMD00019534_042900 [Acytostelium subglobosum LB1]GAM21115.1 hypothetical protein SAMD00019534_042900 [Acytostelium subglobosum LB1]|eukprot:XP_012756249.1 hypothetical protein SAMD00019534_042900 [Acytostelium subglobosum LB1]
MFRYTIACLFLFAALASAQNPICATYNNTYGYGYNTVAFNFVGRHNHLESFAESGGVVNDFVNQRSAVFYRIQFNNTDNMPIFEEGMEVHFGNNNTNYLITNGVCFLFSAYFPIPNTMVPPNTKFSNQVTIGSQKYNSYTSPFFDGVHSYFGAFEQSTCIPINQRLSNVDYTLGEAHTSIFDFSTTIDSNVFNLPPPCEHPIHNREYTGVRTHMNYYLNREL